MKIEVCKGQAGLALYVDDKRVAGPRHNGMMKTILSATVATDALAAKDTALSEAAEKLEQTRVELGEALLVLGATEQNCATALSEMRVELERLRKALEPFAKYLGMANFDLNHRGHPLPDDQGMGWVYLTIGQFRNAARALSDGDAK